MVLVRKLLELVPMASTIELLAASIAMKCFGGAEGRVPELFQKTVKYVHGLLAYARLRRGEEV